MKTARCFKGIVILLSFAVCFLHCLTNAVAAKERRGDAPQCQEECLARHSQRVGQLSKAYSAKTKSKLEYQDDFEKEVTDYSRCLTNCRELLPVK